MANPRCPQSIKSWAREGQLLRDVPKNLSWSKISSTGRLAGPSLSTVLNYHYRLSECSLEHAREVCRGSANSVFGRLTQHCMDKTCLQISCLRNVLCVIERCLNQLPLTEVCYVEKWISQKWIDKQRVDRQNIQNYSKILIYTHVNNVYI